jgi:hypothetical protein
MEVDQGPNWGCSAKEKEIYIPILKGSDNGGLHSGTLFFSISFHPQIFQKTTAFKKVNLFRPQAKGRAAPTHSLERVK